MTEEKKQKFSIDFIGFSSVGLGRYEATIALNPDYDIDAVIDFLYGEDSARVITLVFKPKEKQFGRRGFSLKKDWETTVQGEVTLDSSISQEPLVCDKNKESPCHLEPSTELCQKCPLNSQEPITESKKIE
jgi:hypothetical protein